MKLLRAAALLLLGVAGACGGTKKTTIPVDSPLRPFSPPEEAPPEPAPEPPPEAAVTPPAEGQ